MDIGFVVALCKGLLADKQLRRTATLWLLLGAMLMTIAGALPLAAWLTESPVRFLLYWGVCAWFTITTMLLAAYDMLSVRREAVRERRRLRREIFGDSDDQDPRDDR